MYDNDSISTDRKEKPNDVLRPILKQYISILLGVALLAFLCVAFLSLASWHIYDHSLSHAGSGATKNWMGQVGAILSDVLIQTFGVTSVLTLAPLFCWSLILLQGKFISRLALRVLSYIIFVSSIAAVASSIPVIKYYPLSTKMGGLWGDITVSFLSESLPFVFNNAYSAVSSFLLLVVSILTGLFSSQLIGKTADIEDNDYSEDPYSEHISPLNYEDHIPLGAHILGYFSHHLLRVKYFFNRLMTRKRTNDYAYEDVNESEYEINQTYSNYSHDEEQYIKEEVETLPVWNKVKAVKPVANKPRPKRLTNKKDEIELPYVDFLSKPVSSNQPTTSKEKLRSSAEMLKTVLEDFGVKGEIINVRPGPVVTLYELEPAPGIKSSRIVGLADDIARSMSAISARVAVVTGRNVIGIELPNLKRETVFLREMFEQDEFTHNSSKLPLALGKTIGGEPIFTDLARMPHLLVAGTTGSGKSVAINTMILSLLYRLTPNQCKMIMIDPKMLELSVYEGIPHLLTPVVTDPRKAIVALKWAVREMEDRYRKMAKVNVRNIDGFNQRIEKAIETGEEITRTVQTSFDKETGEANYETEVLKLEKLPYIVIIIDEMADLMMVAGKEIEGAIQRLAQMARAAGIHVIMATQRPSVDVITGTIKANFPTRISFQVTSKIDSRTILGEQGAEQLLGQGDMLFMMGGGRIQRIHGPFVEDSEVETIVNFWKSQAIPQYLEEVTTEEEDEEAVFNNSSFGGGNGDKSLFDQAVEIVARDQKASTSYIQRRLSIGYNRAASIIEQMEEQGLVGPANHAGKREIFINKEDY